jgi:hypothetical protein
LTSELVNALSMGAENFYRRLMSVVDDYGRIEAHPAILRAKCYPLKLDTITDKQVKDWLTECAHHVRHNDGHNDGQRLVTLYTVAGKSYLQINNFQQRTRTPSRCPSPCAHNDGHDDGHSARLVGGVCVVGGEDEGVVGDGQSSPPIPIDPLAEYCPGFNALAEPFREAFVQLLDKHPKAGNTFDASMEWREKVKGRRVQAHMLVDIVKAHTAFCGSHDWTKEGGKWVPSLAKWLKKEGWNEPIAQAPALQPKKVIML